MIGVIPAEKVQLVAGSKPTLLGAPDTNQNQPRTEQLETGPVLNYQAADSFNRGLAGASMVRLQSGMPLAVTQAANFNAAFGYGIQRPNRRSNPNDVSTRSTASWFDTSAFTAAPQFTLSTISRNPVLGPSYQAADVMIGKTIPIGQRWTRG